MSHKNRSSVVVELCRRTQVNQETTRILNAILTPMLIQMDRSSTPDMVLIELLSEIALNLAKVRHDGPASAVLALINMRREESMDYRLYGLAGGQKEHWALFLKELVACVRTTDKDARKPRLLETSKWLFTELCGYLHQTSALYLEATHLIEELFGGNAPGPDFQNIFQKQIAAFYPEDVVALKSLAESREESSLTILVKRLRTSLINAANTPLLT